MIRRTLLAGVALAPLAAPALAQIPVTDGASLAQRTLQQAQTMLQWGEQHQATAQQLLELRRQLVQAQQAYAAVTGVRDLGSAMYALNLMGMQNPMPVSPYQLQALLSGQGGVDGVSSMIAGFAGAAGAANRVYDPGTNDWRGTEMSGRAQGLASLQAVAAGSYEAASQRLAQTPAIRARLAVATDPKEVQDLQAGLAIAQLDAQSHHQQMSTVTVLADAEERVRRQREEERERQCLDAMIAYYRRLSDNPNCPPPSAPSAPNAPAASMVSFRAAGGSSALNTMLAQSWGQQAADNATRLGVNPTALAGTCVVESGCRDVAARPGSTINGAFQMTDATERAAFRAATGTATLSSDPAGQSVAAAQELKSAALALQQRGIASPTVLDTRALYQWGAGAGPSLATAPGDRLMSAALPTYSADVLRSNGITPGVTTVQQWRDGITAKLGDAANQPVLLGNLRST